MPKPNFARKLDGGARWSVLKADIRKQDGIPLRANSILSADAIITDPPYGLDLHGLEWDAGFSKRPEENGVSFDPQTWLRLMKVAKPGAYLLAFGGSRTFHRIAVAIEDGGWTLRDHIMWLHAQGFPRTKTVLKPAFEPIIVAQKRTTSASPQPLQIEACRFGTSWPPNVIADNLWDEKDLRRYHFASKPDLKERDHGCDQLPQRRKEAVMKYEDAGYGRNHHPTVKPVKVMEWLCRLVTPKGGLIYDPFTGSGTTGVAAMHMGFRFIGTEMDPDFVAIAQARIRKAANSQRGKANI